MGKTTPSAEKIRKSTPKTVPKKLLNTSNNMNVTLESKQASFRRAKRDLDSSSIDIASICTPTRTTRSMCRPVPGDMLPPIPSFVTPLKQKTITITKTSVKKSLAKASDNASDGKFVRPRTPKIKVNDVTLVNDSIIAESIAPMSPLRSKRQSVKARKASNVLDKQVAESSEDDLPSVSMLGQNTSAKKVGKFVRLPKSHESNNGIESTDEENLPSVSKLGEDLSSSTKKAKKSVRNRKSVVNKNVVGSTDDEAETLSVSVLAFKNSPGRFARSPQWLAENAIELNQGENMLNNIKSSARKSRKSVAIENPAIESNENGPNDDNTDHTALSNEKVTLVVEAIIENGSQAETVSETTVSVSETTHSEPVATESKSTRRSKQKVQDEAQGSDDGLPSVSFLGTQLKSARKSVKRRTGLFNESIQKVQSPVKRTVTFTSPIIIENPKSDLEASYGNESEQRNESEEVTAKNHVEKSPQNGDQKPVITKNRISVIDLTDSPGNSNRTLNTTFSPKPTVNDASETMNRTFTEDDNKAVLEKTFSPVPSTSALNTVAYSTPMLVLSSPSKPMSTKKSPQLKRLKGTPMRKPIKNLNTPGKLSSAKKMKMIETAKELCDSSVKKQQMKPPKMNASTPKVFRFGEEDDRGHDFRFSLLAPSLNPNNIQNNNKSTVKPMPNFKDIHGRHFKKAESIDEACKNRENRAQLLLSGKKPTAAQRQAQKAEKVEAEKKAEAKKKAETEKKVEAEKKAEIERKLQIKKQIRQPLGQVNRARLNDEQRQERRMQLFKQVKRQSTGKKKNAGGSLEGVRLNRRFELLMKMRSK